MVCGQALKKLGAFTSDASLWNTIRKVDDDGNGNLSFPEFAAMVSMCKDHGSEEDERRLAEAAEKEKNTQPFHLLREALQKPPDERHENELNTILQQVCSLKCLQYKSLKVCEVIMLWLIGARTSQHPCI